MIAFLEARTRVLLASAGIAFLIGLFGCVGSMTHAIAKPKEEQTCQKKAEACHKRCNERYPNNADKQGACGLRTCMKQFDNCVKDGGKASRIEDGAPIRTDNKPGIVETRPVLDKPIQRPPTGGILDTAPVFHAPKPSGTGTAAPN